MKKTTGILLLAAAWLLAAAAADAKAPWLKKAKEAGIAAKDCAHCHMAPKGGKELNDTGKWLVEQKKAKSAKEVDVTWLKDKK